MAVQIVVTPIRGIQYSTVRRASSVMQFQSSRAAEDDSKAASPPEMAVGSDRSEGRWLGSAEEQV